MTMTKTTDKRGRGRPRNPALDSLEKELAVSRRRASTLLREMKSSPGAASDNSEKSISPLAQARLEKILKECQLLEHKVRSADLERRALERELLYSSEAIELLNAALGPVADGLRRMPKFLSARLHGQSMGEIENTLTEEANRLLALGSHGLKTAKSKTSREL